MFLILRSPEATRATRTSRPNFLRWVFISSISPEDLTGWVDSELTEADSFFEEQPVSDKRLFQILTVEIPKKLKPSNDI